jgi:hypothetical protein
MVPPSVGAAIVRLYNPKGWAVVDVEGIVVVFVDVSEVTMPLLVILDV